MEDLIATIEALIFASDEPVSIEEISKALAIRVRDVKEALDELYTAYLDKRHGIYLKEYNGRYIFVTKPEYVSVIKEMHQKRITRLTPAALETLAIIAYKQPITRAEIEEIRGVKAEKTLLTLSKYGLIEEMGRKETIGNPIVYGTTEKFLEHFDLTDLSHLPEVLPEDLQIVDDVGEGSYGLAGGEEEELDLFGEDSEELNED
ncbi:MAG: SMC-Scp complex subunit ScpB [Halanaerobiaceae bacterium]|nr:SMC-Scp complex subunit ScpB [Halanaerobiaceae bacterium]